MAATGFFLNTLTSTLTAPKVIYRQPAPAPATSTARPPSNRLPAPTPTIGGMSPPTQVFPVNIDPGSNTPQPVSPSGPSGFVPSPAPTGGNGTTAPPTTGPETASTPGGTGSTGSDRVLDLIASLLKPQDISQPLSPQVIPETQTGTQGTNPMALVILAIAVIGGIFWYAHHKSKRRAA